MKPTKEKTRGVHYKDDIFIVKDSGKSGFVYVGRLCLSKKLIGKKIKLTPKVVGDVGE